MKIAAFNVENLFDRIKAFSAENPDTHKDVLEAFSELNKTFEKPLYTEDDKKTILKLMKTLGILKRDEGSFIWLRKIRGKLVTRPRNKPVRVVANGRADWVGWCELKTSPVKETAIEMTARVIADVDADILAFVEVESRPVLVDFHKEFVKKIMPVNYKHKMVIDGNDARGIDVGILSKGGTTITSMRSHVEERFDGNRTVFSRDCPEFVIETHNGTEIVVLPNHFKSKYGGNDLPSRTKRKAQANFVTKYYNRLLSEGYENIVVLGDLNDTPDSDELSALYQSSLREVTDHPEFTEFEFNANTGDRGIGTFQTGADSKKIDYIFLSPALWDKVKLGGIFRKGCYTASHRWEMYPEMKKPLHAASDHHCIWVDLDIE